MIAMGSTETELVVLVTDHFPLLAAAPDESRPNFLFFLAGGPSFALSDEVICW